VVWQSEEFPTGVYGGALAISGETAFAAVDDELWALDIADGTLAWKASLPDVVHTSCETCFTVVGDSLIVQTADAQVLAFGTDSSEARWGHRLVSPSGSVLVAGAGLAVIDDSPDQPGARQVQVLDPATGATVSTFVPVCDDGTGTRDLSFTDSVYALPGSPDLVATVSFGGGCAVRWNGTTGQVVWAAPVGDLGSPNRDGGLVTDTRLVVASSTGLSSIDLASGAVVAMAAPPDTSVSPVAQQGDLLVAQSATSRGTTKVGLVGYDAVSGQIRWQAPVPGDSELLQVGATSQDALFAGAPRSLLITDGGDLSLATFDGEDRTISVSAVDPATGKPGEPVVTTLPARSGTPSVLVHDVRAGGLLFTIDSKVVHVGAGGEVVSFPEL
jgi:outer membrane protein assembly factor BamB